jgi:hypothetical protein
MSLHRYKRPPAEHPWEGLDELDEVSGSGWMRLTSANLAVGLIKFHGGDRSGFQARRVRRRGVRGGGATT